MGTVEVPDVRLDRVHELGGSKRRLPTVIQFVDIAGLVEGASEGEGLGNKFLGNIREVDAIVHVLRCFDDPDITHVLGEVDPVRDREIVETELALSDLETVERRLDKVEKKVKSGGKDAIQEKAVLDKALAALEAGKPVRSAVLTPEELPILKGFQFLPDRRGRHPTAPRAPAHTAPAISPARGPRPAPHACSSPANPRYEAGW